MGPSTSNMIIDEKFSSDVSKPHQQNKIHSLTAGSCEILYANMFNTELMSVNAHVYLRLKYNMSFKNSIVCDHVVSRATTEHS